MLKLENVQKTYNKGKTNEFEALKGIDFKVDDGELVAVITAAIMAANGGAAVSADKLVVRSIKRVKRR